MNRKLFYIYDRVKGKWVKPTHIGTKENGADIGTKNLYGSHFDYLANRQFTRMHGASAYGPSMGGGGAVNNNTNSGGGGLVKNNNNKGNIGTIKISKPNTNTVALNSVKADESMPKELVASLSNVGSASTKVGGGTSSVKKPINKTVDTGLYLNMDNPLEQSKLRIFRI